MNQRLCKASPPVKSPQPEAGRRACQSREARIERVREIVRDFGAGLVRLGQPEAQVRQALLRDRAGASSSGLHRP